MSDLVLVDTEAKLEVIDSIGDESVVPAAIKCATCGVTGCVGVLRDCYCFVLTRTLGTCECRGPKCVGKIEGICVAVRDDLLRGAR